MMFKSIIYSDDDRVIEEDDTFQSLPKTALDDAVEIAKVMCIDLGGGEELDDGGGPYASRYQEDGYGRTRGHYDSDEFSDY